MKVRASYTLTVDEIKQALTDYINKRIGTHYDPLTIDGFSVNQSSEDIRVYTAYVGFEEIENGSK